MTNARFRRSRRTSSRRAAAPARERGVASVLAMMFLILFGSLSTAMAIASRGNIRTAATHLHVSRARGAAETGLSVALARLEEAASRFVVARSTVDEAYGEKLWTGDLSGTGDYLVLPPPSGNAEESLPDGIADALMSMHGADANIIEGLGVDVPTLGAALAVDDPDSYAADNWVYTPPVMLEAAEEGAGANPPAFQITYAPLANGTDVRIIATGYDFAWSRSGDPITRTIMQDVRFVKRVDQAIVSPSKIMIGKNALVTGDLGARFDGVEHEDGDPMVVRSDFAGLDDELDAKLDALAAAVADADIDHDNRLRAGHPVEGAALPDDEDFDGDGSPDGAFNDVTGDGYVDEFDVFISHYDEDGDGRVILSSALTDGTPSDGRTPEFDGVDEDLALLLDSAGPDRNRNGVWGFDDEDGDGRWDAGEQMNDYDEAKSVYRDQVLGYRDGAIDKRDQYAKIRGRVVFKVAESDWEAEHGDVADRVQGPIRPGAGESAMSFEADDNELPDLDAEDFADANAELIAAADGGAFAEQVAGNLDVTEDQLDTYEETEPSGSSQPRYLRVDPDANLDGLPDNSETAYFEKMPYNSPSYTDMYYRPVYENMTFKDVTIPLGNNGLFKNCTFAGVTRVMTSTGNGHVMWSEYGKMTLDSATGRPAPAVDREVYGDSAGETSYPDMLPESAIPPEQMILMAETPLDKADIPDNESGGQGYDDLPEPLVIGGRRVTDTKTVSNNVRFHDCLFVGSIVSDAPEGFTQARNKLQFSGSTRFTTEHPEHPDDADLNPDEGDLEAIAKSSMLVPNYSVDIGTFNSPPEQDVRLQGAVIAGVLDIRGNTEIEGVLLLTYEPVLGEGALQDVHGNPVGNPAGFNASIGYFGPEDGDQESLDPETLPLVDGVRIVGWDLDADGIADLGPDEEPTQAQLDAGAVSVPFHGYGRIHIRFNEDITLPDGIMLPMRVELLSATYREGTP